jgi:uncharacterized membrane protein YoaK (UPF0700 family)
MLSKPTPLWILTGAMALACIAGCVNAVGFLSAQHQALSHLSGTISNLGIEVARADWPLAAHAALVVVFFFLGCVLSGMIIRQSTLRAGRRYGVAMCCESLLLFATAYLLRHNSPAGAPLAAMACGLQNAMATSYSGAVVRTTHMTGIVTDLGIAVGLLARGERLDWRRLRLYLVLLAGFAGGSVLGGLGYLRLGSDTLLYPGAIAGVTGVAYTWWKHRERRGKRHDHPTPPAKSSPSSAAANSAP